MIADYICNSCGFLFEYKKPYGKDFPKRLKCPNCKSMKTKKKLGTNIIVPDDFKAVNAR